MADPYKSTFGVLFFSRRPQPLKWGDEVGGVVHGVAEQCHDSDTTTAIACAGAATPRTAREIHRAEQSGQAAMMAWRICVVRGIAHGEDGRDIRALGERDYYLAWGPPGTPVEELVTVPGARWRVEEAIKLAKSACGLADYEARSFHGWYRHITLAQLAAAFLAIQDAAALREQGPLASQHFRQEAAQSADHTGGRG